MTGSGTQFNMNVNEVISNRLLPDRRDAAREAKRQYTLTTTSTCLSPQMIHFIGHVHRCRGQCEANG